VHEVGKGSANELRAGVHEVGKGSANELRAGVHEVGKGSANELRAGVHEVGKGSAGEPLLNLVQGCTRLEKGQEQSIHGAAELSALEAFFWSESLLPPAATS